MEPRLGFIHENLDIKILILFILRRLPGEVSEVELAELCQCDTGVGYFEYSDCLSDLLESGHVVQTEDGYRITEKGSRNADAVETSLPYSVRSKAERLIEPVQERMRREALLTAKHSIEDGICTVTLAMSDGAGEILRMQILSPDEEHAKKMEKTFRRNAESLFNRFTEMLLGE